MEKVNYTAEQTAELVTAYVAEPTEATVEAFAASLGKSVKSIVAKLVREGVYVSKAKVTSGKRVTKAGLIAAVEGELGLVAGALATLEKASLADLQLLASKIVFESQDVDA